MVQAPTTAQTYTYNIDEAHSTIRFWVRHMMIAKVHGELSDVTGTVRYSAEEPEKTELDITIKAESLTTRQDQRDAHLKSADFLDVQHFPTITFRSKKVTPLGDGRFEVLGDMTLHGTTRELSLKAELTPEVKDPFGGYRLGVSATGAIDREDFDITWNQALETGGVLVGKEITFEVDAEIVRKID